jgi:Glycosyl transferases group 1/Glycosyl transferase family 4 group
VTALRVGFVLCSNLEQPLPSTRIAVLNMLPFLRSAGMEARILFASPEPSETPDLSGVAARALEAQCDVVVFQKVRGPQAVALAVQLSTAGVRTVFVVCDVVDVEMVRATDAATVVTEYLRSLYPKELQHRIHVVHDGIERPQAHKSDWSQPAGGRLSAVLVTSASLSQLPVLQHPPAWLDVRIVGRYASGVRRWQQLRWTLAGLAPGQRRRTLSFLLDRRIQCVPWTFDGAYEEMLRADIGIIPVETPAPSTADPRPAWMVKSENRLTMKMSIGLPVVAVPVPAYQDVIEHGVTGYFASSPSDWLKCLSALRDPDHRAQMGRAARASVAARYSMVQQSAKLLEVLKSVHAGRIAAPAYAPADTSA